MLPSPLGLGWVKLVRYNTMTCGMYVCVCVFKSCMNATHTHMHTFFFTLSLSLILVLIVRGSEVLFLRERVGRGMGWVGVLGGTLALSYPTLTASLSLFSIVFYSRLQTPDQSHFFLFFYQSVHEISFSLRLFF